MGNIAVESYNVNRHEKKRCCLVKYEKYWTLSLYDASASKFTLGKMTQVQTQLQGHLW